MKVDLECWWADNCASSNQTVDVNSFNDFIKKLKNFFEHACGFTGVESFDVIMGNDEFQWNNQELHRSEDLSDVWNEVETDLEDFFNENFNFKEQLEIPF